MTEGRLRIRIAEWGIKIKERGDRSQETGVSPSHIDPSLIRGRAKPFWHRAWGKNCGFRIAEWGIKIKERGDRSQETGVKIQNAE